MHYEITVQGHLDARWKILFEGFAITHTFTSDQQPITTLIGPVTDQSALYGILSCLRDLGVVLISVHARE